jgi:Arc/MetJ family transcription regulator
MRTNIEIDDDLMRKALEGSGSRTKKEVVERALRLMVQIQAQTSILKLRGKVEFDDSLDYSRPGRY